MRMIITGIVILMLAGCATPEQQVAEYQGACARLGVPPGTQDFNNCVGYLISENQRSAAQASAWFGVFGAAGAAAARSSVREGGGYDVQCTGIQNGPYTYTNCR